MEMVPQTRSIVAMDAIDEVSGNSPQFSTNLHLSRDQIEIVMRAPPPARLKDTRKCTKLAAAGWF